MAILDELQLAEAADQCRREDAWLTYKKLLADATVGTLTSTQRQQLIDAARILGREKLLRKDGDAIGDYLATKNDFKRLSAANLPEIEKQLGAEERKLKEAWDAFFSKHKPASLSLQQRIQQLQADRAKYFTAKQRLELLESKLADIPEPEASL